MKITRVCQERPAGPPQSNVANNVEKRNIAKCDGDEKKINGMILPGLDQTFLYSITY